MTDLLSPQTTGFLTLFGNVKVLGDYLPASYIAGHLSLNGAVRTFERDEQRDTGDRRDP